jgi:hypothetical protein
LNDIFTLTGGELFLLFLDFETLLFFLPPLLLLLETALDFTTGVDGADTGGLSLSEELFDGDATSETPRPGLPSAPPRAFSFGILARLR